MLGPREDSRPRATPALRPTRGAGGRSTDGYTGALLATWRLSLIAGQEEAPSTSIKVSCSWSSSSPVASQRSACRRSAFKNFASETASCRNQTPYRSAESNLAPASFAPEKSAPDRFAIVKSVPEKICASQRYRPKLDPCQVQCVTGPFVTAIPASEHAQRRQYVDARIQRSCRFGDLFSVEGRECRERLQDQPSGIGESRLANARVIRYRTFGPRVAIARNARGV